MGSPIAPEHVDNFDGFWGKVDWLLNGGGVGRGSYDWDGNYIGIRAMGGTAPCSRKYSKPINKNWRKNAV